MDKRQNNTGSASVSGYHFDGPQFFDSGSGPPQVYSDGPNPSRAIICRSLYALTPRQPVEDVRFDATVRLVSSTILDFPAPERLGGQSVVFHTRQHPRDNNFGS